MTHQIDVVLTGRPAEDAAAHSWARARARRTGHTVRTVGAEDLEFSTSTLAVVGRPGARGARTTAEETLGLADRSRIPLVTVSVDEPLHPATELADRPVLPVAVGVPTGTHGSRVLDVAADEAHAIGTDLTVIRVWRESDWLTSADRDDVAELARTRIADADRLDEAVLHVHHRHPDLDVMSQLRDGSVFEWLTRASRLVECLVLGTGDDGRSPLTRWAIENVAAPLVLVDTVHDRAPTGAVR